MPRVMSSKIQNKRESIDRQDTTTAPPEKFQVAYLKRGKYFGVSCCLGVLLR